MLPVEIGDIWLSEYIGKKVNKTRLKYTDTYSPITITEKAYRILKDILTQFAIPPHDFNTVS